MWYNEAMALAREIEGTADVISLGVSTPRNLKDPIRNLEFKRFKRHVERKRYPNKIIDSEKEAQNDENKDSLNQAIVEFLRYRADVLASGGRLTDATVEVGKYINKDYPKDQPPNEVPHPFSKNKIFISFDEPYPSELPDFIISQVDYLVSTGLVGTGEDVFKDLLNRPDNSRYDSDQQYSNRVLREIEEVNSAFANTKYIADRTQRRKKRKALRSTRGRLGETLLVMAADPDIKLPIETDYIYDSPKTSQPTGISVAVGDNRPVTLGIDDRGPSGISMFDLLDGGAEYLVAKYRRKRREIFSRNGTQVSESPPEKISVEDLKAIEKQIKGLDDALHFAKSEEKDEQKEQEAEQINNELFDFGILLLNLRNNGALPPNAKVIVSDQGEQYKITLLQLENGKRLKTFLRVRAPEYYDEERQRQLEVALG